MQYEWLCVFFNFQFSIWPRTPAVLFKKMIKSHLELAKGVFSQLKPCIESICTKYKINKTKRNKQFRIYSCISPSYKLSTKRVIENNDTPYKRYDSRFYNLKYVMMKNISMIEKTHIVRLSKMWQYYNFTFFRFLMYEFVTHHKPGGRTFRSCWLSLQYLYYFLWKQTCFET